MNPFYKTTITILCVIFGTYFACAQNTGIGIYAGGGYISGESPDIGSFTTNIYFDADWFNTNIFPRVSFIYASAFSRIVPDSRKKYFPFMKGLSLKGVMQQDYKDNLFLEEGIGLAYLNDRTFSTTNSWNPGVAFSLTGGLNLLDQYNKGFRVGVGTEYAFVFGGTFLKYFSLHLQAKYQM
jgi:hypothetical protein